MTEAAILRRIIKDAGLADVAAAFTGTHPENSRYTWNATASLRGESVIIEGLIYHDASDVGRFQRRLYYAQECGQAYHEIIEIDDAHQGLGVGGYHYAKSLRFYEQVGIRFISLKAESMGVVIWPQFGFDLSHRPHRERLVSILKRWDVEPVPSPEPGTILAPEVVFISIPDDREIGERALYELADLTGEGLPMRLDLENQVQRDFLQNRGILSP